MYALQYAALSYKTVYGFAVKHLFVAGLQHVCLKHVRINVRLKKLTPVCKKKKKTNSISSGCTCERTSAFTSTNA